MNQAKPVSGAKKLDLLSIHVISVRKHVPFLFTKMRGTADYFPVICINGAQWVIYPDGALARLDFSRSFVEPIEFKGSFEKLKSLGFSKKQASVLQKHLSQMVSAVQRSPSKRSKNKKTVLPALSKGRPDTLEDKKRRRILQDGIERKEAREKREHQKNLRDRPLRFSPGTAPRVPGLKRPGR